MSRIRSIHPGLWTDDAFMGLSVHARLLFIGLWNEAYDDGVFEWKPRTLKARIFPADNVNVEELLAELCEADSIREGGGTGKMYGLIRNFRTFQRPKKPNSSGLLRDEDREYVGLVPNQFGTDTEKSEQMEDGGGREGEEIEPLAQQPETRDAAPNVVELVADAAGINGNIPPSFALGISVILGLVAKGYDLELDILAAIRAKPNPRASSPAYFVPQIEQYAEKRRGANVKPPPPEMPADRWKLVVDHFHATGDWNRDALGPKPGEAGCRVPANLVSRAA